VGGLITDYNYSYFLKMKNGKKMNFSYESGIKLIAFLYLIFFISIIFSSPQETPVTAKPNTYDLEQCAIYRLNGDSDNYFIRCKKKKNDGTEYG